VLANEIQVASDASAGDQDGLGMKFKFADHFPGARFPALGIAWNEDGAFHPGDGAAFGHQFIHPVTRAVID